MLVTFSGLDGAGKSTLIRALVRDLEDRGRPVHVLTMYDHVGLYAMVRGLRRRLRGEGAADPVHDPDRLNVTPTTYGWATARIVGVLRSRGMRRLLLVSDIAFLLALRFYWEGLRGRVLVMDRYFYDSIADVSETGDDRYTRVVLRLLPTPIVPVFVHVDPAIAFARKGEYTVEHLHARRAKYLAIFSRVRNALIIENRDLDPTVALLREEATRRLRLG